MIANAMDYAYDGQTRYLISYYDRTKLCRVYYLNRSSFSDLKSAEREIILLKNREIKNGYKTRIRFKIEKTIIKKAINKSVG